jgi:hypothetical protein
MNSNLPALVAAAGRWFGAIYHHAHTVQNRRAGYSLLAFNRAGEVPDTPLQIFVRHDAEGYRLACRDGSVHPRNAQVQAFAALRTTHQEP